MDSKTKDPFKKETFLVKIVMKVGRLVSWILESYFIRLINRVSKILLLNGDSLKVCTVSITNSIKLSIVNFY
ncbi:hypothetical protein LEP1GSC158_1279 [Leptospira interrogans serovar Zanoni str. LT2156]|uniref:Uncharacterized protein n=1 Tax=Leptospira interrogans serovar Zanoni str. LT2156 TaxID=1001601 RepID=M6HN19_LEPIR|nr:hypothetical protein LEP1GSC158_1279 [Leptospira interrogans serovar Zanoni str. LT2156]